MIDCEHKECEYRTWINGTCSLNDSQRFDCCPNREMINLN